MLDPKAQSKGKRAAVMPLVLDRPLSEGDKVAVVDDVQEDAAMTASLVSEAGFEPVVITPPLPSLDSLLSDIRKSARAVVCDHRLSDRGRVKYYGAEVVARSNQQHFPAVLITTYADVDYESIRLWRAGIPCMLKRGREAGPDEIIEALNRTEKEVYGVFSPERKPYRAVVRVENIKPSARFGVAEVVVSAWNPAEVIEIPVELIRRDLKEPKVVSGGSRYMADVNIFAPSPDELYFRNFEPAPEIPEGWPEG
jgi:hypothetical protein